MKRKLTRFKSRKA